VGPTLVAMAMKFGLGTEIQSPTGLLYSVFLWWLQMLNLGRLCGVMPASNADDMALVPALLLGLELDEGVFVFVVLPVAIMLYM